MVFRSGATAASGGLTDSLRRGTKTPRTVEVRKDPTPVSWGYGGGENLTTGSDLNPGGMRSVEVEIEVEVVSVSLG